jgi:hypothetical protein
MDEGELEEGMTLKELFQVLKEKKKVGVQVKAETEDKVKVEVENEVGGYTPCDKNTVFTWIDLLLLLISERSFFSLGKAPVGGTLILKVESSRRVLDCFFERAWERLILKSRPSIV